MNIAMHPTQAAAGAHILVDGREHARVASRRHYEKVRGTGKRAIAPRVCAEFLADLDVLARETGASSELYERLVENYAPVLEERLATGGKLVRDARHRSGTHSAQRHVSPKSFAVFEALRGYGLTNAAVLAGLIAVYREDLDGPRKLKGVDVKVGAETNELIAAAAAKAGVGIDELVRGLLSSASLK